MFSSSNLIKQSHNGRALTTAEHYRRYRVPTAELARPLGQPTTGAREPIGGVSPNKARFEIDWRDPVGGAKVRVRIIHSRD